MQIVLRNVDQNNNPVNVADPSFLADEQTAINILSSTFLNNITLTFNVGFGFIPAANGNPSQPAAGASLGVANFAKTLALPYEVLRSALFASGQPNFFGANLPVGNVGQDNFYISSSVGKALGFAERAPGDTIDGFIGISTAEVAGPGRVDTILHEIGHAMGRLTNIDSQAGIERFPGLDLFRFVSAGNRLFTFGPDPRAYFSVDGGATTLAQFGLSTGSDLRTPNDPYNETGGSNVNGLTTVDVQILDALGLSSPVINPAPPAATTAVMVLRSNTTAPGDARNGLYQIYDLGNNGLLPGQSFTLGRLGTDRQFVTLGRFNDGDTNDILLRNPTGAFQVYDIANNSNSISVNVTTRPPVLLGGLGPEWQPLAFGSFGAPALNTAGNTDMIVSDRGAL